MSPWPLPAAIILALGVALHPPARIHGQGRPVIIIVHGRGHLGQDSAARRVEWKRALELGVGIPATDSLLLDEDVRLAWYADVLDPRSDEGCEFLTSNPGSRARWKRDEASRNFSTIARGLLGFLAGALDSSASASETRGALGDMLFAVDSWKRCGAERRLELALRRAAAEKRPVVLVSHSLGALLSYDVLDGYAPLSKDGDGRVQHWFSLASLLGAPVVRSLVLQDTAEVLPRPSGVRRWTNVRNPADPFALPANMGDGDSVAVELQTQVVEGEFAHELSTYLRDERTARVIVAAWCGLFRPGDAPSWCGRLHASRPGRA